jgi:hypothetical protein
MPLAHLIFFPEPRELTEAQIEEARVLGHLRPEVPAAAGPITGGGAGTVTSTDAGASGDGKTDE